MNEVLSMLANRVSTRTFTNEPITDEEREAIFQAAFRAPTAGNMMLYSIIDVTDQALKDKLAVLCDEQAFIAKAPLVLVFVADYQKWVDLYEAADVQALDVPHRAPGKSEMMLSCLDATIAAQNAVVGAESLGIGSCYIGDVLENGEEVARLLDLPQYTLPIAMVVFGRSPAALKPHDRQEKYVVHENSYHRLTDEERAEVIGDLAQKFAPNGFKPGIANYPQSIYARKHTSDFMREMDRSVAWWIDRWSGEE